MALSAAHLVIFGFCLTLTIESSFHSLPRSSLIRTVNTVLHQDEKGEFDQPRHADCFRRTSTSHARLRFPTIFTYTTVPNGVSLGNRVAAACWTGVGLHETIKQAGIEVKWLHCPYRRVGLSPTGQTRKGYL